MARDGTDALDLFRELRPEEQDNLVDGLGCTSPNDGKYRKERHQLDAYLTPRAEWLGMARVQDALLATRVAYGQAPAAALQEFRAATADFSPENMHLLEGRMRHDVLASLAEMGRHLSDETAVLLHPGTTSYDVIDTLRAVLFRDAWSEAVRPVVGGVIHTLCDRAVHDADVLRVGRTHLQGTSPVTFGWHFAQYAARLADRFMRCDDAYANLRGKVRGIVGTGASIEQVVGVGGALGFERDVLAQLGLLPHRGSSQIVPRENLADAAHAIATLGMVLGDFANDIRLLYATGIAEVTTSTDAALLGLSSADATKNNPVNYENVIGKATMLKHLMGIVYELIPSDLERDLTNSVMGRYEPQGMMVMVHEMHARMGERCLPGLTIVRDNAEANLQRVRDNPGEAMTAILRGVEGWRSSTYGPGHDFVNKVAIQAQKDGSRLLDVAMTDPDFAHAYHSQMTETQRAILGGQLELYVGAVPDIIASNVSYARDLAARSFVPAVSVK